MFPFLPNQSYESPLCLCLSFWGEGNGEPVPADPSGELKLLLVLYCGYRVQDRTQDARLDNKNDVHTSVPSEISPSLKAPAKVMTIYVDRINTIETTIGSLSPIALMLDFSEPSKPSVIPIPCVESVIRVCTLMYMLTKLKGVT